MARKRPQHIQELVDEVNIEMRRKELKLDETNRLFWAIQGYLIKHKWYQGFNFFHEEFRTIDGSITCVPVLHGSDQGYDFIQFM